MTSRTIGPPTRDAFGETLAELGESNEKIVVVDGDVIDSTRTKEFFNRFPRRAFNIGIAESNLVGIGAGLAASGKIPVIASFSCFVIANAFDQLRMGVAFPGLNAKIVGSHGGISAGEDGPSQMSPEDLALAGGLGGFTVIVPADAESTRVLTREMIDYVGPVFMRTGRPSAPVVYPAPPDLTLGKASLVRDGTDLTIIACGLMVAQSLDVAEQLSSEGIETRVIDMHTVKPIDELAIEKAANETGRILVAEEHFAYGGLGSAVAMVVGSRSPVKMAFVNIGDEYSTSGQPEELFAKAGITTSDILQAARKLLG